MNLASLIDHTLLKPDATTSDVQKLCDEARQWQFHSVCINPVWVSFCSNLLAGSDIQICSVVGFPLGASLSATKADEARRCISDGATEIDMVMSLGHAKMHDWESVGFDIESVAQVCEQNQAQLKVILETGLLSPEEIRFACEISEKAGAHFVKTSTGFLGQGATEDAVLLMKKSVGDRLGVKASGGIRDLAFAKRLLACGATRLGMSASVALCQATVD